MKRFLEFKSKYFNFYIGNRFRFSLTINSDLMPNFIIAPIFFCMDFKVPIRLPKKCQEYEYGIVITDNVVLLYYGKRKFNMLRIPFFYKDDYARSIFMKDGTWQRLKRGDFFKEKTPELYYTWQHSAFRNKDGTTESCTYTLQEYDMRRKWLEWLPFLSEKVYAINVTFESGKQIHYRLLKGEEPYQGIKRLQLFG